MAKAESKDVETFRTCRRERQSAAKRFARPLANARGSYRVHRQFFFSVSEFRTIRLNNVQGELSKCKYTNSFVFGLFLLHTIVSLFSRSIIHLVWILYHFNETNEYTSKDITSFEYVLVKLNLFYEFNVSTRKETEIRTNNVYTNIFVASSSDLLF